MDSKETSKAVKFRIDTEALSDEQLHLMDRCAGTTRAFWNWALALWNEQEKAISKELQKKLEGKSEKEKEDAFKNRLWNDVADSINVLDIDGKGHFVCAATLEKAYWRQIKNPEHPLHWFHAGSGDAHGVPARTVKNTFRVLEAAVKRYRKLKKEGALPKKGDPNVKPRKDGMDPGWPHFKTKHDREQGFVIAALNHLKGKEIIESSRRVYVHKIGSLRISGNTRRLREYVANGGIIKTARFTKRGGYWYVAFSVTVPTDSVRKPTESELNRQKKNGKIGVDLGVSRLATLSNGETIENPRRGRAFADKKATLQTAMHGKTKGSKNRAKVKAKLARLQHKKALQRKTMLDGISKDLTTRFETVALENLNVKGMTAKVKPVPDPDNPGKFLHNNRAAKSGLNREILDLGFYELRRQIEYKAELYGSNVDLVDRYFASSKTCHSCGAIRKKLSLKERTFRCECGYVEDRDLNAALNIRDYSDAMAKKAEESGVEEGEYDEFGNLFSEDGTLIVAGGGGTSEPVKASDEVETG